MEICNVYKENRRKPIVIALGFFDCVHIGHRKLIERTKELAKELDAENAVFTFNQRLGKFKKTNEIYSFRERLYILESLGVQNIVVATLNDVFAELDGKTFFNLLVKNFDIKGIVCGKDYRFGKGAKCGIDELASLTFENDIHLVIEDFVIHNDEKVSTSMISDILVYGDLDDANKLLGEPYFILDTVVSDCKRGHMFGCPTANVHAYNGRVKLKCGVYATTLEIGNKKYAGVTNVGHKPTFNDFEYTIETYIINFNATIYGELVKINFLKYIRKIEKFNNAIALRKQIMNDVEISKEINKELLK